MHIEKAMDKYAEELLKKRKEEEKEIVSMLKTSCSNFLNTDYDRHTEVYKQKTPRKEHIEMFLAMLDNEIFYIKNIIQKAQHDGKTQQEIFSQLKIIFVTKHLVAKICISQLKNGTKSKLLITEKEFCDKYMYEICQVRNLYPYVDRIQSIFTNSYKKVKSAEEQNRYIDEDLLCIINDFFKKQILLNDFYIKIER